MEVVSKMKPVHATPEMNDGKSNVEMAGYVPTKQKIEEFKIFGARLAVARREQYDFETGEEDDGRLDPTRSPGFDMADASQISRAVQKRLNQQASAAAEKKRNQGSGIEGKSTDAVSGSSPS